MKMAVLYHSKTGKTKEMAEIICAGMAEVDDVEAKSFSIDGIDADWIQESKCIVVGSPTYYASVTADIKTWLETKAAPLKLAGKLGGGFATANYIHGGGETAIRLILDHMLVLGMLTYSGGGTFGNPTIHFGPVSVTAYAEDCKNTFRVYGKRMATKAMELFG